MRKLGIRSSRVDIEAISFENLSLDYHGRVFLDHVNFDFVRDSIFWIKGADAGHESYLLRVMAGLTEPKNGNYKINETLINQMSFEEFLPFRLNIGYSFDYGGLINNRTLAENLLLPLIYHNEMKYDDAKKRVSEFIDFFNLHVYKDKRPASVPGGIRKLTCVLRSMILSPQILLLDHPTVGLSKIESECLSQWLSKEMAENRIRFIVISSSDEEWMKNFQHQTVMIHEGYLSTMPGHFHNKAVGL